MLGLTFMEERADLRGSKVMGLIQEVASDGVEVFVHDPEAGADEAVEECCVPFCARNALPRADAVMAEVAHHACQASSRDEIGIHPHPGGCVIDARAAFDATVLDRAMWGNRTTRSLPNTTRNTTT